LIAEEVRIFSNQDRRYDPAVFIHLKDRLFVEPVRVEGLNDFKDIHQHGGVAINDDGAHDAWLFKGRSVNLRGYFNGVNRANGQKANRFCTDVKNDHQQVVLVGQGVYACNIIDSNQGKTSTPVLHDPFASHVFDL